jgi:hypothetical protein
VELYARVRRAVVVDKMSEREAAKHGVSRMPTGLRSPRSVGPVGSPMLLIALLIAGALLLALRRPKPSGENGHDRAARRERN